MSQELDYKKIIKQEYIKCAQDVVHFLKTYCYISHPQRGRLKFNLYPFQEKSLNLLQKNDYSIILKSRQLGISTLVAGISLWMMTFQKDKNILCIATKQETAKNMVTKVKFMYESLPSWLKVGHDRGENNKLTLKLNNNSQIKATSAASDAGRSEAVSLLIVDEAAFIEGIDEIWASSQQTLSTGGKAIVLSTPFGTGNWFHKTWVKALNKENKFLPIKLPWWVHPERDEEWRAKQDELLGDPRLASQECDADFTTSGDTVFYPEWLKFIEETTIKEPLYKSGHDQNLWVWEDPDYSREYMVICDVSRGDGKDFSGAHVMDIESNSQVAEFKGQLSTTEYGNFLVGLATTYNNALLVIENNNVGWAVIETVIERQYRNLYHSPKSDQNTAESYLKYYEGTSEMVPGFTMSLRTRPLVINKFKEMVGDKSTVIRSKRLLEEMKVFVWKYGRPEAQSGYNDDLVMPYGIGQYLRDTSLRFRQESLDRTKATLNNIGSTNQQFSGVYGNNKNPIQNPYKMQIRNNSHDIKWLL